MYTIIGGGPMGLWMAYTLLKNNHPVQIITGTKETTTGLYSGHQVHLTGCIPPHETQLLKWYKLAFLPFSRYPVSLPYHKYKLDNIKHLASWYFRYIENSFKKNQNSSQLLQALGRRSLNIINEFNSLEKFLCYPSSRISLAISKNGFQHCLSEARMLQNKFNIEFDVISKNSAEDLIGTSLSHHIQHELIQYPDEKVYDSDWQKILIDVIKKKGGIAYENTMVEGVELNADDNITKLKLRNDSNYFTVPVYTKPIVAAGSNFFHVAKELLKDNLAGTEASLKKSSVLPVPGLFSRFKFREGSISNKVILAWQDHFVHISGQHSSNSLLPENKNIITVGATPGVQSIYTRKQVNYRNYVLKHCFASPITVEEEHACFGRPISSTCMPQIISTKKAYYLNGLGYVGMTVSPALAEQAYSTIQTDPRK